MDTTEQDISSLRDHILDCRNVSSDSKAVQIALEALDNEMKRINRDKKLREKFAAEQAVVSLQKINNETTPTHSDFVGDKESQCDELKFSSKKADEMDESLMEWQDVGSTQAIGAVDIPSNNNDSKVSESTTQCTSKIASSPFSRNLSETAISDMSKAEVYISSPLAALALVLHSALKSSILGFKCTGIPEEDFDSNKANGLHTKKKSAGFAAPVRELPKGKYVPDNWDKHASIKYEEQFHRVCLRYRKDSVGSTILSVKIIHDDEDLTLSAKSQNVQVKFGPVQGEPKVLNLPLHRHINLDSLNTALSSNISNGGKPGVQPALHYKALPVFMAEFCTMCDLGSVEDSVENKAGFDGSTYPLHIPKMQLERPYQPNMTYDSSIPVGDFSGDLLPSGLPPVGFADPLRVQGIIGGGNMMGPNHPTFQRNSYDDFDSVNDITDDRITPGGLSMRPRFDPLYPPNSGIPSSRGRGRGRRGQGLQPLKGEPNPDHQRPPSDLGGNMFM